MGSRQSWYLNNVAARLVYDERGSISIVHPDCVPKGTQDEDITIDFADEFSAEPCDMCGLLISEETRLLP